MLSDLLCGRSHATSVWAPSTTLVAPGDGLPAPALVEQFSTDIKVSELAAMHLEPLDSSRGNQRVLLDAVDPSSSSPSRPIATRSHHPRPRQPHRQPLKALADRPSALTHSLHERLDRNSTTPGPRRDIPTPPALDPIRTITRTRDARYFSLQHRAAELSPEPFYISHSTWATSFHCDLSQAASSIT